MTYVDRLYLLDRLHHLIRRKSTGTPSKLAYQLGVSERTVYNLVNILRNLGAEVSYCNQRYSYYYEKEIIFNFLPILAGENVKGGKKIIFLDQKIFTPIKCNSNLIEITPEIRICF